MAAAYNRRHFDFTVAHRARYQKSSGGGTFYAAASICSSRTDLTRRADKSFKRLPRILSTTVTLTAFPRASNAAMPFGKCCNSSMDSARLPPERGCVQSTSRSTLKGSAASGIFQQAGFEKLLRLVPPGGTQPRSGKIFASWLLCAPCSRASGVALNSSRFMPLPAPGQSAGSRPRPGPLFPVSPASGWHRNVRGG